MTLSEFQQLVTTLAAEGEKLIDAATTSALLEEARTSLLGRKSGRLPELFKQLPTLAPGELRVTKTATLAGTGTHPVALGEVQPQSKQRMAAADWARGVRPADGDSLI